MLKTMQVEITFGHDSINRTFISLDCLRKYLNNHSDITDASKLYMNFTLLDVTQKFYIKEVFMLLDGEWFTMVSVENDKIKHPNGKKAKQVLFLLRYDRKNLLEITKIEAMELAQIIWQLQY